MLMMITIIIIIIISSSSDSIIIIIPLREYEWTHNPATCHVNVVSTNCVL